MNSSFKRGGCACARLLVRLCCISKDQRSCATRYLDRRTPVSRLLSTCRPAPCCLHHTAEAKSATLACSPVVAGPQCCRRGRRHQSAANDPQYSSTRALQFGVHIVDLLGNVLLLKMRTAVCGDTTTNKYTGGKCRRAVR